MGQRSWGTHLSSSAWPCHDGGSGGGSCVQQTEAPFLWYPKNPANVWLSSCLAGWACRSYHVVLAFAKKSKKLPNMLLTAPVNFQGDGNQNVLLNYSLWAVPSSLKFTVMCSWWVGISGFMCKSSHFEPVWWQWSSQWFMLSSFGMAFDVSPTRFFPGGSAGCCGRTWHTHHPNTASTIWVC